MICSLPMICSRCGRKITEEMIRADEQERDARVKALRRMPQRRWPSAT